MNAIGTALQGLGFATKQVGQSAAKIANPREGTDMAEEIVNIKIAEANYKANLATLRASEEMSDELLRIFDERV